MTFVQGRRAWLPVFSVALALLAYAHNWGLFLAIGTVAALVPDLPPGRRPARRAARRAARPTGSPRCSTCRGCRSLSSRPSTPARRGRSGRPSRPSSTASPTCSAAPRRRWPSRSARASGSARCLAGARRSPRARAALSVAIMGLDGARASRGWPRSSRRRGRPATSRSSSGPVLLLGAAGLARGGRLGLVVTGDPRRLLVQPAHRRARHEEQRPHRRRPDPRPPASAATWSSPSTPSRARCMHYYLPQDIGLRWADAAGPGRRTRASSTGATRWTA